MFVIAYDAKKNVWLESSAIEMSVGEISLRGPKAGDLTGPWNWTEEKMGNGHKVTNFATPIFETPDERGIPSGWIRVGVNTSHLDKGLRESLYTSFGFSLISLLVASALVMGLLIRALRTIGPLTEATQQIAEGNLSVAVPVSSEDELGMLAKNFNRMAKNLKERTEELQSTQGKLLQQEKLAAVGQLASGVGHELRNPLGVLKNAVYFLRMKLSGNDEKVDKHLKIMDREIDNSAKIINDLLGFSRTRKPTLSPSSINEVVRDALSTIETPPNVVISQDLSPSLPNAIIDRDQIRQVFINMVLNAIQAMHEAGGMLNIRTRSGKDFIETEFRDTGCGIPKENIKSLFDPFFTTKSKGIGLGLAVSHGIIERHGGRIEVTSTVGQGTTFLIKVPMAS